MKTIKIFYSWQSDLPRDTNNNGIRLAIKEACVNLKKTHSDLNLLNDEATREVPGSPNIPLTIFSKICNCDIFIADISTINQADTKTRKVGNPNVLIELGYAISIIGWGRILLLFNKEFGKFPDDVPFDISKHRIIDYKIINLQDSNGKGQLVVELIKGIDTIFKSNPIKPIDQRQLTIEEKRKINDTRIIKELLKSINLPTMDTYIRNLPDRIDNKIFFFWEDFIAKYESSYFYIYDKETKDIFDSFKEIWDESLSFGHRYHYIDTSNMHVFTIEMDIFTEEQEKDYKKLIEIRKRLFEIYSKMITIIREKWIDIDLNGCSDEANNNYIQYHQVIENKLRKKPNKSFNLTRLLSRFLHKSESKNI